MPLETAAQMAPEVGASQPIQGDHQRLRELVVEHYPFVWRTLRRFGVSDREAEDAAQEVFVVAMRRFSQLLPGRERAFLFGTAIRIASRYHRSHRRRREDFAEPDDSPDSKPGADELIDRARAREVLYGLLDEIPIDNRAVFVLFEIEGTTMAEIAEMLSMKPGTVASRLRAARDQFAVLVRRFEAGESFRRGAS